MTEQIGRSIKVRSLFSKYDKVQNPIISDLISSLPESFSSAVKMFHSSSSSDMIKNGCVLDNRLKLRKYIEEFHFEANTDTAKVSDRCDMLCDPATEIITSIHQPNLFPYSGVFKKIVLSQNIKRAVEERSSKKKNH
ncbi:MAG: hypothetical protein ICV56_00330 [Nitrososphaeraceae archaeon]|nr:hypothetical protein [Nitrososphaeraceae archaeon]